MSEFKKRFQIKRILAAFLAVIMVVTMVPPSAVYAAQDTNLESTADSEDIQSIDTAVDTDTNDVLSPEEAGTEGQISEAEEIEQSADTEESTDSFDNAEGTAYVVGDSEDNEAVGIAPSAVAITFDPSKLPKSGYDADKNTYSKIYSEDEKDPFFYDVSQAVDIKADNETDETLKGKLSYTWTPDDPNVSYPNAGSYKLIVSLNAIPGVCEKTEITADTVFEIKKAEISVELAAYGKDLSDNVLNIPSGETVDTLIAELRDNYSIFVPDVGYPPDKDVFVTTPVITIREVGKEAPLAGTAMLLRNKDYFMSFSIESKNTNYTVKKLDEIRLVVGDLIPTTVEVTKKTPGQEISRLYEEGKPVNYQEEVLPNIDIKVFENKNQDKDPEVLPETVNESKTYDLKYSWVVADGNGKDSYVELDEDAPVNAGTYYLKIEFDGKYNGEFGTYAPSCEYVRVVINPIGLYVQPEKEKYDEFYEGTTVAELLQKINYNLALDAERSNSSSKLPSDKEALWGVSYYHPDETQHYVPVFKVQRKETEGEGADQKVSYKDLNDDDPLEFGEEYRLVFSGQKGIYDTDGNIVEKCDINEVSMGSDTNYAVTAFDDTALELGKNAAVIEVQEAKPVAIDTAQIKVNDAELGTDYKEAKAKAQPYSGTPVFAKREDYKKASVTSGTTPVTTGNLTYTWYEYPVESLIPELDDKDKPVIVDGETSMITDEETPGLWKKQNVDSEPGDNKDSFVNYPEDAGIYKLRISYEDPTHEFKSASKDLYIVIDPQLLKAVHTSALLTDVFENASVSDYVNKLKKLKDPTAFKAYKVEGNDVAKFDSLSPEALAACEFTDMDVEIDPYVVRAAKMDENGDPLPDTEYEEVGISSSFQESYAKCYGAKGEIKIKIKGADTLSEPERLFKKNYKVDSEIVKLNVAKMGNIAIKLKVDEKLTGRDRPYDGTPFTLSEDEKKALVKVINTATEEEITDFPKDKLTWTWKYKKPNQDDVWDDDAKEILNAGTYTLKVKFEGNETYKNCASVEAGGITITPRKITIAPKVNESVKAGDWKSEIYNGIEVVAPENPAADYGLIEEDKGIFTRVEDVKYPHDPEDEDVPFGTWSGYPALAGKNYRGEYDISTDFSIEVFKEDETESYHGFLRYGTEYQIRISEPDAGLAEPYKTNYDVTYTKQDYTVKTRGESTIGYTRDYDDGWIKSNVTSTPASGENGKTKITVTPLAGIPFYHGEIKVEDPTDDGKPVTVSDSNFYVFDIAAPAEFKEDKFEYSDNFSKFVFKNAFKDNEKAHLLAYDNVEGTITVLVDAAAALEGPATFTILWEEGYEEDFEVSINKDLLEADLTKAVAPKALKFNGVNTKMVVGETQQLDVKVTKVQLTDIICLGYKVLNGESVSVTDDGHVTALQPGVSTVQVFAAREVDGEKEPLSGKEAKSATVKITVKDVSAPVVKKATATDTCVKVEYTKITSGYRREIYILKGKNLKANIFEDAKNGTGKVPSMKDNNWEDAGFAAAPLYLYEGNETYNEKTKLNEVRVYNLEPDTDYTVYVRNVSGIRTLTDGSSVKASAAGTVKSFKTTKSQVQYLEAYFDKDKEADIKYIDDPEKCTYYSVDIAKKTAQVSVKGLFKETIKNSAIAEDGDYIKLNLPLDKTDSADYLAPKLGYYVVGSNGGWGKEDGAIYWDADAKKVVVKRPTNLASINNKGKLTLKGTGTVWIYVVDIGNLSRFESDDGDHDRVCDEIELDITAAPTSVTGKTAKLRVGQGTDLYAQLQYKQNKIKLTGYEVPRYHDAKLHEIEVPRITNLDKVTEQLEAGGYEVEDPEIDEYGANHLYVTPKTPSSAADVSVDIRVGSSDDEKAFTGTATIKLTTQALDPVKSLKQVYIEDDSVLISFQHTGICDGFNIEIKDTRNLVRNKFTNIYLYYEIDDLDDIKTLTWFDDYSYWYYPSKKTNTYYCRIDGLARQSKYTISVTAAYDMEKSKTASKKVTTTKIPAASAFEYDLLKNQSSYELWEEDTDTFHIGVYTGNSFDALTDITDVRFLQSGNTYTLSAKDADPRARARITDTLTWTSTNKKVATVKANPGTYTATLKAVKNGVTNIELKSKITKKVIARWPVYVKAVGEADKGYFGSYDPVGNPFEWDAEYIADAKVLTTTNPVRIDEIGPKYYTYVSFTAPSFGGYEFNSTGNLAINSVYSCEGEALNYNYPMFLKAGQTIYLKVYGEQGTVSVSGGKFATLTKNAPVRVTSSDEYICFIAPADNVYTFTADKNRPISAVNENGETFNLGSSTNNADGTVSYSVFLTEGKTIYLLLRLNNNDKAVALSVTDREVKYVLNDANKTAEDITVTKDQPVWISFKAPADAEYSFTAEGGSAVFDMAYYKDIKDLNSSDLVKAWEITGTGTEASTYKAAISKVIKKDDVVILRLSTTANSEVKIKNFTVNVPKYDELTPEKAATVKIKPDESGWITFTPAETGRYKLNVTAEPKEASATVEVSKDGSSFRALSGEVVVEEDGEDWTNGTFKVGETYYFKVIVTPATADSKDEITATVSLVDQSAQPLPAESVEFKNGSSYCYTFTAAAEGLYVFKANVTKNIGENAYTHKITVQEYNPEDDYYFKSYGNYEEVYLYNNQKVLLKVSADSLGSADAKTTAKFTFTKVEPVPFSTEKAASIELSKDNEAAWYSFTADEDTYYTFTRADEKESVGAINVSWSDSLRTLIKGSSILGKEAIKLNKGTYYFRAAATGITEGKKAAATLSVAKLPVFSGTEEVTLTKEENQKTYSFTAPLGDFYIVTTSDPNVSVNLYDQYDSDYTNRSLTYGEVYRVVISAPVTGDPVKYTVSLTPRSEAGLSADAKAGGTYYTYTAKDGAGWYKFTLSSTKEGSTISPYIADIQKITVNKRNVLYGYDVISRSDEIAYLKAGTTCSVRTYLYSDGATDEKIELKAEKLNPSDTLKLEGNGEITLATGETDKEKYYTFTADVDGSYTFTSAPETVSVTGWKAAEGGTINSVIPLKAGESALVRYNADTKTTFTPVVKAAITEKLSTKPTEFTVKKDERKKFEFKVFMEGLYTIQSDFAGSKDVTIGSLSGGAFVWSSGSAINSVRKCRQNDILSFEIENNSEADLKINLHAALIKPEKELAKGTAQEASVKKGALTWVSFKAPADGRYVLTATNREKLTIYRYNTSYSYLNEVYKDDDALGFYQEEYDADQENEVKFAITASEDITTSLTVSDYTAKPLAVGENEITVPAKGTVQYQHTSDAMNQYKYTLEPAAENQPIPGDTLLLRIGSWTENALDDLDYIDADTKIPDSQLRKGDSRIFVFENVSDAAVTFKLTISKDSTTLTAGSEAELKDGLSYYSFTLPADGVYEITRTDGEVGNISNNGVNKNASIVDSRFIIGDQNGEVLFSLANYSNEKGIKVQVNQVNKSVLKVDSSISELPIAGNTTVWIAFKADTSKYYEFRWVLDHYYNYDVNFYQKNENGQYVKNYNYNLKKNDTVYIAVRNYSSTPNYFTISVH